MSFRRLATWYGALSSGSCVVASWSFTRKTTPAASDDRASAKDSGLGLTAYGAHEKYGRFGCRGSTCVHTLLLKA